MIIEHVVKGQKTTSWHNFNIRVENFDLIISQGEYWQGGIKRFSSTEETILSFEDKLGLYNIYVTDDGILDLKDELEPENKIDRIAWLSVHGDSLKNVDINFIKIDEH